MLATLLFSQGVPMLLMGDEVGRTQRGNNNGYCQDNELSWMDWESTAEADPLSAFVKDVLAIRRRHPAIERRRYFRGERVHGSELKDITWFRTDGQELGPKDWASPELASLAMLIDGQAMDERDALGQAVGDDLLCLVLNAESRDVRYVLPAAVSRLAWDVALDTSPAAPAARELAFDAREGRLALDVPARAVVLLHARRESK
jgi:glycogen operon protein